MSKKKAEAAEATKPHWTTQQAELEAHARNWSTIGGVTIRAMGQLEAIKTALRRGLDWPASEVPTPCLDALARLEAGDDPQALMRFRRANGLELQYEQKCRLFVESWAASEASRAAERAKADAARAEAAREVRVATKLAELTRAAAAQRQAALREKAERATP